MLISDTVYDSLTQLANTCYHRSLPCVIFIDGQNFDCCTTNGKLDGLGLKLGSDLTDYLLNDILFAT